MIVCRRSWLTLFAAELPALAASDAGLLPGVAITFEEAQQLFRRRATFGFSEELIAAVENQHLGASNAICQATQSRSQPSTRRHVVHRCSRTGLDPLLQCRR